MTDKDQIKSTKRSFKIIDIIEQSDGAKVADIVEELEVSRTSVYKHLRTLKSINAVDDRNGEFVLGPKLRNWGDEDYIKKGNSSNKYNKLHRLASSLDAPVNWWVLDGENCVCHRIFLPNEGRANPREENERRKLVESVPGRVIISSFPDSRRRELLKQFDNEVVSNTREQIQSVEERGALVETIAVSDVKWFSITAPVDSHDTTPNGAVEVVIPSERARGLDIQVNIIGLILDTVKKLGAR